MKRKSLLLLFVCLTLLAHAVKVNVKNAVDFVNPLVGSDSNPELSSGNTYPAIAMSLGYELLGSSDRKDGRWMAIHLFS